ncbi:MAG: alpha/beta hydrolase [Alphaproteobacteria bacterium]|nr:alpha/beta hydrolase [Alphaproteobacteria bacterium]MBV9552849.1 alpha/beta hydrolase [Alphaproteobacteria bacterium]
MTDFFPGFAQRQVQTAGATINLVVGGSGPPLLLLHGYPQTHAMWRKVAPRLADRFTVVAPDLRGYGDSSKPPAGDDYAHYSKRALAQDQVETMAALGFERFAVAGHDRGARVTHRLLRDHGDKITRAASLDIVPTLYRFETIDQKAATGSWHWFFLIQGRGLPEHMIGGDPEFFLRHMFGSLLRDAGAIEPAAFAEYLRCFKNLETIRATCDEYRAGASIDLIHDRADLAQKVAVPMLILWGAHSGQGAGYDMLRVWRDHATDVRGHAIDSGHFIPEEKPDEVCAALREFFS